MSRVSLIQQLYGEKKTALEFNFERLSIPPMNAFLTTIDIQRLHQIASSVRYAGNIDKKYEMIDKVMKHRSFHKLAAGTNRVVYYHLEDPRFVAKIAIDKVGLGDNPKEFKNQQYLKPFCTKVFEVDPTGTVAFVERVNPITSIEEFASVGEDVFNLITQKIIGKYVLDDIGVTKWMNYGCRMGGFGPVILDFPYVYELDGNKLYCQKKIQSPSGVHICRGEIDYDPTFDFLVCSKCGKKYKARDLESKDAIIKLEINSEGSTGIMTRARIIRNGKIYKDSAPTSKTYVTKEQFEKMVGSVDLSGDVVVDKVVHLRSMKKENKARHQNELMMKYYSNSNATPTRINGVKKARRQTKQESNNNRKYDSKIKTTVEQTEQPVRKMEQQKNYDAKVLHAPVPSHLEATNTTPKKKTAFIRTNLKRPEDNMDRFKEDYAKMLKTLADCKTENSEGPKVLISNTEPKVSTQDRLNFIEALAGRIAENVGVSKELVVQDSDITDHANREKHEEIKSHVQSAFIDGVQQIEENSGSMIKDILSEDNKTRIETILEDVENSDSEEAEEDVITLQAIEMIKKGMYNGLTQPSYRDTYKEVEEEKDAEPVETVANDEEYEDDDNEIPFDNFAKEYRRKKRHSQFNDDMSEY